MSIRGENVVTSPDPECGCGLWVCAECRPPQRGSPITQDKNGNVVHRDPNTDDVVTITAATHGRAFLLALRKLVDGPE